MKKILFAAAIMLSVASCKKDKNIILQPPPKPNDTTVIDTFLTQDIYKVTAYNISKPALILLSPYSILQQDEIGHLMIFNEKGQLLIEKTTPGAAFCFRRWVINGQIRYTYIVNNVDNAHIPNQNQLTGYVVIADENLNEIKKVHLKTHNDIIAGPGYVDLDVHDFILLNDDHYITMSYYPKKVSNIPATLNPDPDVQVISNIIQEIQNDAVIWQWDATEHPELYEASVEGNDFTNTIVAQDYLHMNSMTIDPKDNNLICSYRNLDQVLKINRTTGAIVWRLGGKNSNFPISNTQYFMRQHNATLINNNHTLMLFDNGEVKSRPYSRVLEFDLNEVNRTITGFRSFNIPEPFSQYMGSVQKFGDNYFIGGGTGNFALEINANTKERNIEFLSEQASYRAYKYELK